jgi:hypothetical protein
LFQKDSENLSHALNEIKLNLLTLEQCIEKETPGAHFKSFLIECSPTKERKETIFKGTELKETYNFTINDSKTLSIDLHKTLLKNLKSRFPIQEALENFCVFDLEKIRDEVTNSEYGNQQISNLSKIYGLNSNATVNEYVKFKTQVLQETTLTRSTFWKNNLVSQSFQNLSILFQIYLTIPISTAGCERIFSRMNLIKTEIRNRMSLDVLNDHLTIALNGCGMDSIKQEIEQIKSGWNEDKTRRKDK